MELDALFGDSHPGTRQSAYAKLLRDHAESARDSHSSIRALLFNREREGGANQILRRKVIVLSARA
jgi:hypothetical protein